MSPICEQCRREIREVRDTAVVALARDGTILVICPRCGARTRVAAERRGR